LPFIRSLEVARTTTSALVRNLSIRLSLLPSDSTATNGVCLTAASKQLATLIASRLEGLTSFSYQIAKAPVDPFRHPPTYSFGVDEQVGIFPLETAASLVDSLPASCSIVEFATFEHDHDATGSGSIRSTDTNCLCEALRRRVPHLEHLRLQGITISYFVFGVLMTGPCLPKLHSLFLDITCMDIADRLHSQYAHLGPQYALKEDTTGQNLEDDLANSLRGQNLVARELRSSYQAGRFPSITRLFVQDLHDYRSVLQDDWRLNTFDILLGRIEVVPVVCIDLEVDPDNQADQDSAHDLEATAYYSKEHGHLRLLDETYRTFMSALIFSRLQVQSVFEC
jgi:hypothetical protein